MNEPVADTTGDPPQDFKETFLESSRDFIGSLIEGDRKFRLKGLYASTEAGRRREIQRPIYLPANLKGNLTVNLERSEAGRFLLIFKRSKRHAASISVEVELEPSHENVPVSIPDLVYRRTAYAKRQRVGSKDVIVFRTEAGDEIRLKKASGNDLLLNGEDLKTTTYTGRAAVISFFDTHADALRDKAWSQNLPVRVPDVTSGSYDPDSLDAVIDMIQNNVRASFEHPINDQLQENLGSLVTYLPQFYRLPSLVLTMKAWTDDKGQMIVPDLESGDLRRDPAFQVEVGAKLLRGAEPSLQLTVLPSAFHVAGPFHEKALHHVIRNRQLYENTLNDVFPSQYQKQQKKAVLQHLTKLLDELGGSTQLYVFRLGDVSTAKHWPSILGLRNKELKTDFYFYCEYKKGSSVPSATSLKAILWRLNGKPTAKQKHNALKWGRIYIAHWLRHLNRWMARESMA